MVNRHVGGSDGRDDVVELAIRVNNNQYSLSIDYKSISVPTDIKLAIPVLLFYIFVRFGFLVVATKEINATADTGLFTRGSVGTSREAYKKK